MSPETEKALRAETVNCLVALSKAFTQSPGHKALTHWTRLDAALAVSLTGVSTMGQWQESIRRRLLLPSLPSWVCSAMERLDQLVSERSRFDAWVRLVKSERAWFIVQLRLESERRAAEHAEKAKAK